MRYIVTLLLALALGSTVGAQEVTVPADTTASTAGESQVIAYYFYTTARCASCLKIERYTDAAVHQYFSPQLAAGTLAWQPRNTDDDEHSHFIKDYKLFTKSVVLAEIKDGQQVRWKNLDKVWTLLRDEAGFKAYIRSEIESFLGS